MGKQRKKEKTKLSRKKKKQIGKEKKSIAVQEPSIISEDSLEENRDADQVNLVSISDEEKYFTEGTPDRASVPVEGKGKGKGKGSEPRLFKKFRQARKLPPWLVVVLLLLLFITVAFVLYGPAVKGQFVFDDKPNILENSAIRLKDFSFAGLKKAVLGGRLSTRPVANITFALNYLGHEYNVYGYHIFNIMVHAINGFLLFFLFRLTLKLNKSTRDLASTALPFAAALIWFVHPMQSQSVAYVVQRMNSMAAMFYILALLCYAWGRLAGTQKSKYFLFAGCIVSGLLAIGSKEISATLPAFIFLFEWYFFQDLDYRWIKKKMVYIFGVFIISMVIAYLYVGDNPADRILAGYKIRDFTLEQRLLTQFLVVFFYLSQLVFPIPSRLSLEHDFPLSYSFFNPPTTIVFIGALLLILAIAIIFARKYRLASFAILWFFGNLFIESSFVPLEIIFEHRVYLPSMFLILTATILTAKLIKMPQFRIASSCLVIVILSAWTFERSTVWGDDELLMRDCVAKAPNKSRMYANLGHVLTRKGKYEEAFANYYTALKIDPNDEIAYLGLGDALNYQGKYKEAITNFNTSLIKNKGDKRVTFFDHFGMGFAYAKTWNFEKAIYHYSAALQVDPSSAEASAQLQKAKHMLQVQKARERR